MYCQPRTPTAKAKPEQGINMGGGAHFSNRTSSDWLQAMAMILASNRRATAFWKKALDTAWCIEEAWPCNVQWHI